MNLTEKLLKRSGHKCELCSSSENLEVYEIPPQEAATEDNSALLCSTCFQALSDPHSINENHWRCLAQSMWSEYQSIQVLSWRLLNKLQDKGWAQDLFTQLYLDEKTLQWAESFENKDLEQEPQTKDSNGAVLNEGDSVTLIKDLDVKGAKFTAKRGTLVKNIHLTQNTDQVEGRVNGTVIVLLTKFLKKVE